MQATIPRIRAYACRISGSDEFGETIYNTTSPSKARRKHHREVSELFDIPYTSIRSRLVGDPHTSDALRRTAEYRGVPHVRAGTRVQTPWGNGTIIDAGGGANFSVLFDLDAKWPGNTMLVHIGEITLLTTPQQES